ncbi:hypothetical protein Z043_125979, partial [Scleropages formosus]
GTHHLNPVLYAAEGMGTLHIDHNEKLAISAIVNHGMWDQIRVDHGKEFYLSLFKKSLKDIETEETTLPSGPGNLEPQRRTLSHTVSPTSHASYVILASGLCKLGMNTGFQGAEEHVWSTTLQNCTQIFLCYNYTVNGNFLDFKLA